MRCGFPVLILIQIDRDSASLLILIRSIISRDMDWTLICKNVSLVYMGQASNDTAIKKMEKTFSNSKQKLVEIQIGIHNSGGYFFVI